MIDVKLYKKIECIISFINHVEQFTSLDLKSRKLIGVESAITMGYHPTSLKTAMRFFRGMDMKKFEPLLHVEDDMVHLKMKYNLYRGIHTEASLARVMKKGVLRIDDSNKQTKEGVVRLTPNLLEAGKYAEIKKEKQNSVTGIVIEIQPETIMDSLSIGMYGFERFNADRDLKPNEYKIYKIVVHENNPILYLYSLLSEVLKNQNINLEEVLQKTAWID